MSRHARVAAQAKVNLALRVLEREASGYHAIETIFARLELADDVVVRTGTRGRSIDCRGATWTENVAAEQNLAYRAALAYAAEARWPGGFAIEIEKRIPMGGGLGGGSADAGAVLRALDALAPHPLGAATLSSLASALGADVPFLTSDAALALGRGHGDVLMALDALRAADVHLVVPPFGVSTADAYRWLDAERAGEPVRREPRLAVDDTRDWAGVARVATNDFEPAVFGRHPELAACVASLRAAGADIALMSGSGSTVFGVWFTAPAPSPTDARAVVTRVASRVVPVEVAE